MPAPRTGSTIDRVSLPTDPAVRRLIELARAEDLGVGDISSSLLPDVDAAATFDLVARVPGTLAGCEIAGVILREYDPDLTIEWRGGMVDGASWSAAPAQLARVSGPLGSALAAERVLLNFLQRLCGVATLTRRYVDAVAGTSAKILDTRKTIPGWRKLDKYAVRCGGGVNHREGLFDAVLIKDSHLQGVEPRRIASFMFDLLNELGQSGATPAFVEVEVDRLEQVEPLLGVVGVDIILLDNFAPDAVRAAVQLRDDAGLAGKVLLEASGGITLANVRAMAETEVDRISIGAITHSAVALDLGLDRV